MAVLVLDLPVLAVDVELGALVLADLAPGIDGILLPVEVTAATGRAVFLDVPAAMITCCGQNRTMLLSSLGLTLQHASTP